MSLFVVVDVIVGSRLYILGTLKQCNNYGKIQIAIVIGLHCGPRACDLPLREIGQL